MPNHQVRLTVLARNDLALVRQYSLETWGPRHSTSYAKALSFSIESLADFPERGRLVELGDESARRLVSGKHVIYCRVLETEIEVLRILHERLDASAQID